MNSLTNKTIVILSFIVAVIVVGYYLNQTYRLPNDRGIASVISHNSNEERTINKAWLFNFDAPGTLNEAGSLDESTSPYWWVSSGGMLVIEDGIGRTNSKTIPVTNRWYMAYRINNSLDTDSGRYPQNLFRLVSKDLVGDSDTTMSYRISRINLTDTPNRDVWSGVFLFSRYKDSDNLYYAGIRQDGHAVIKKKINGRYFTLGEVPYFKSFLPYQKDTNPNFIPGAIWQKMRLVTKTEGSDIKLSFYLAETGGDWKEILTATDDGVGGDAFIDPGRFGIRTDFMDVEFDDYKVIPL